MQNRNPDPSKIIDRLKERLEVESDAHLAELLGVPASTLANWRRRRSLPYAICVRAAQEIGISLDWLILGQTGPTLDASALALAAYHSRDALPLLELGEVEADVLGEAIGKWYGEYTDSLDRMVETGRTREQATRLLYGVLAKSPRTGAITEAIELQSLRRPSGTSESGHADLRAPNGENQPEAPEPGMTEGPERPSEQGKTQNTFNSAFGDHRRREMPRRIRPGPEYISSEKANALEELVREAADYQIATGTPEGHAKRMVSALLGRRYGAPRYELIPKEFGDEAITWMNQHVDGLRSKFPGADYVPWRTALYVAIHNRCRRLGYSKEKLYGDAADQFGKPIDTLRQLNDENLRKFYGTLMA